MVNKVSTALSSAKNWVSENKGTIGKAVGATVVAVALAALTYKFGVGFHAGFTPSDASFGSKFYNGGAAGLGAAGKAVSSAYRATADAVTGAASKVADGVRNAFNTVRDGACGPRPTLESCGHLFNNGTCPKVG